MYGQTISFLFVLLILYYVVMILLDIRKANAMKAAELEKNSEEEIDISDEAESFKPVLITREVPNKSQSNGVDAQQDSCDEESSDDDNRQKSEDKEMKNTTETLDVTQKEKPAYNSETDSRSSESEEKCSNIHHHKNENGTSDISENNVSENSSNDKPYRREGYREALMTDGLEVERFLEEAEILASTGKGSLGDVVYEIYDS